MSDGDLVIYGVTTTGKTFRPSDWAERLADVTAVFDDNQKIVYSPFVVPAEVEGTRALIVGRALSAIEPRLFQFFRNFAHDNELAIDYVENALSMPEKIPGPHGGVSDEPREPV
ncbi:MAG TPA: DUF3579 domain-containing protein [Casimicrobiaceae bacterium]|nr:DUF3579 domain-containing protein [Casimicrobiaceae bacterium]